MVFVSVNHALAHHDWVYHKPIGNHVGPCDTRWCIDAAQASLRQYTSLAQSHLICAV